MKPKIFKRALFGGFDRADVMNYIAEEHARFLSEKKELSDRLEQIGMQLTAVQQELDTLQQQNEAVQQELAVVSAERDEMQHELQTQAGRILTQARINAQSVVHDARIKADAMQQQSERLLQNARGGLDTTRESLAGARDALRELLDETLEQGGLFGFLELVGTVLGQALLSLGGGKSLCSYAEIAQNFFCGLGIGFLHDFSPY